MEVTSPKTRAFTPISGSSSRQTPEGRRLIWWCRTTILLIALLASPALGAPPTDTQLFKSGVSSFQKNHFPAAAESFTKLLDAHPSSPLRDMTLYYLARSYLKTGNRQKAAQVTARLMREFPASYNTGTIDSELLKVVRSFPEASPPSAPLPLRAPSIEKPAPPAEQAEKKRMSAESAAEASRREKAAKDKEEQEKRQREKNEKKPAAEKKEQERVALKKSAHERADSEKSEKELLAARKKERQRQERKNILPAAVKPTAAQAVTALPASPGVEASTEVAPSTDAAGKAAPVAAESTGEEQHPELELDISSEWHSAEAGTTVAIPFTIANRGPTPDRYRLKSGAAHFPARVTLQNSPGTLAETTPDIAPGDRFSGILNITVPSGTVDGFRIIHPMEVRSLSEKGPAVSREVRVVVSAPLLRAVVRTPHKKAAPGEMLAYTVTILNVGSASATDLTVRLVCPPSYQAQSLSAGFRVVPEGLLLEGLQLAPGEGRDLGALFRMDEVTADGEELVCRADIIDNRLNTRGSYLSGRIVAVKK